MRIKSYNKYYPLLLFLLFFVLYSITLAPGVIPEDSGELATAGFSLGVPHPPGYPLYVLLLKLFLFLPVKGIILKANLFSALFASLSVVVLYQLLISLHKDRLTGVLFTCLFAFSRTFWSQAVMAEVYTLNIFLIILYLYINILCFKNIRYLKLLAFLSGLLMVSHYSNSLIILSVIIILFIKLKRKLFKIEYIFWGLFPLTLFFIFYIRSQQPLLVDWGNPETPRSFMIHVLRLSFGSMVSKAPRTISLFLSQVKMFLEIYAFQFSTLISLIIGAYFLISLRKIIKNRDKSMRLFLILLILLLSLGVVFLLNYKVDEEYFYINQVFFIPFFLVMIIVMGYNKLNSKLKPVLILIVCLLFFNNFIYNNRSNERLTYLYNKDVLKSCSYKGVLFSAKDFSTFPLLYYQKVKYIRPDLKIYDWFGNVFEDIFSREDFHLIPEFKRDAFREQITDKIRMQAENEVYYSFQRGTLKEMKSLGVVYTFNKKHKNFIVPYLDFPRLKAESKMHMNYFTRNMISVYYFHLAFYYKQEQETELSDYLFDLSNQFGGNEAKQYVNLAVNAMKEKKLNEAIEYLKQAILHDDAVDRAYFYLGNIYFQQKKYSEAEKMYIQAIQKNKLNGPAYNTLGSLYLQTGDTEKAKEIFQSGLFTGYGKLYYSLGSILIKQGQLIQAKDLLEKGIKYAVDNTTLYIQMSVVLSKLNDWAGAKKYLEKAYKINQNDKTVLLNLSLVYIKMGQFTQAERLLREGQQKFPQAKEFPYYLSVLKKQ